MEHKNRSSRSGFVYFPPIVALCRSEQFLSHPFFASNPVIHLTNPEIRGKICIVMQKFLISLLSTISLPGTYQINTEDSMENILAIAIPVLLAVIVIKILFTPMKWIMKLAVHALCGFVCLWLLNSVSGFTGLELPINALTVLVSGTLGAPGIAIIALLEIL